MYAMENVAEHAFVQEAVQGFRREANLAQYGGANYGNAKRVERGISLERALAIAKGDPEIAYFVYVKGGCMVLPVAKEETFSLKNDPLGLVTEQSYQFDDGRLGYGLCRIFHHGDTVFFKGEGRWLGSAPGLADVYTKE